MRGAKSKTAVILLVEDDPDYQKLTQRALKTGGIPSELFVVDDGEQALDYLYRRGEFADPDLSPRPDLILLDLNLPKLDGRAVLKRIKQDPELRRIAVVIVSTSSDERDILLTYDLGVNSYVTKPSQMESFTKAIRDLRHYWFDVAMLSG
jgi:CheY-like chemotaxis protein